MIKAYFDARLKIARKRSRHVAYGFIVFNDGLAIGHDSDVFKCGGMPDSNEAEWCSLLHLLKWLEKNVGKEKPMEVMGDSLNVIEGLQSKYTPKCLFWVEACTLASQFPQATFSHVPRKDNYLAHKLAKFASLEASDRRREIGEFLRKHLPGDSYAWPNWKQ